MAQDAAGALDRAAQPSLFSTPRLVPADPRPLPAARQAERGPRPSMARAAPGCSSPSRDGSARAYAAWYSLRFDAIGDRGADVMTSLASRACAHSGIVRRRARAGRDAGAAAQGVQARRLAGLRPSPATGNWRIATEGMDFAAYWARAAGAAAQHGQAPQAKSAGLDIEIYDRLRCRRLGRLRSRLPGELEARGRLASPSCAPSPEQEGAAGTLRLGIARKDGRPVAAQLWLVENGEACIHKLAYAEGAKAMSPGHPARHGDVPRARSTRIGSRAIDYGTGDDAYKRDWMAERRALWRIQAFNPRTLRGLAGRGAGRGLGACPARPEPLGPPSPQPRRSSYGRRARR